MVEVTVPDDLLADLLEDADTDNPEAAVCDAILLHLELENPVEMIEDQPRPWRND